jgi:hypothetical protein
VINASFIKNTTRHIKYWRYVARSLSSSPDKLFNCKTVGVCYGTMTSDMPEAFILLNVCKRDKA